MDVFCNSTSPPPPTSLSLPAFCNTRAALTSQHLTDTRAHLSSLTNTHTLHLDLPTLRSHLDTAPLTPLLPFPTLLSSLPLSEASFLAATAIPAIREAFLREAAFINSFLTPLDAFERLFDAGCRWIRRRFAKLEEQYETEGRPLSEGWADGIAELWEVEICVAAGELIVGMLVKKGGGEVTYPDLGPVVRELEEVEEQRTEEPRRQKRSCVEAGLEEGEQPMPRKKSIRAQRKQMQAKQNVTGKDGLTERWASFTGIK